MKTVTLYSQVRRWSRRAVPIQLSFHGLVTNNFVGARYGEWLNIFSSNFFLRGKDILPRKQKFDDKIFSHSPYLSPTNFSQSVTVFTTGPKLQDLLSA